jgi:GNAT superfamily N-acetyltransferase
LPSSTLLSILTAQAQNIGAKGFLIEEPPLPTSYVAELAGEMAGKNLPFCLGITCVLSGPPDPEMMASAHQAGIKFIHWRDPADQIATLTKTLWYAFKAGIWNHVELSENPGGKLLQELMHYVAANPNIAHSWSRRQAITSPFGSPSEPYDKIPKPYSRVADLPGHPLWCGLVDPVYLLLYLNKHGLKKIMRWRIKEDGRSIYPLGQNLVYNFVRPEELPPGYLDEICRMVEAGGSVATQWVRRNLEQAFLIGYVMEKGVIVGNSSLKRPRTEYVERVNKLAGLDISQYLERGYTFSQYLERGYTSVRPEYRGLGIGTKLLEGLTARVGKKKLFSIISADNVATQKIALRNKTKQAASFYSERLGKEVGVWIPESMIGDDQRS